MRFERTYHKKKEQIEKISKIDGERRNLAQSRYMDPNQIRMLAPVCAKLH